ncbi:MAG TPA: hypothetical protein VJ376_01630 [Pseudomonadota bacterium]|nr:hypothetical protein [Pseudomonadota bacterium]
MIPFLPFPLPALAVLITGGTLEKAAAMANHASTRTTQLYDGFVTLPRRDREVSPAQE